jgi:hypothetical protein
MAIYAYICQTSSKRLNQPNLNQLSTKAASRQLLSSRAPPDRPAVPQGMLINSFPSRWLLCLLPHNEDDGAQTPFVRKLLLLLLEP